MKISKNVLSIGLTILSAACAALATYLDVRDSVASCEDTYREELREIVREELDNRVETS